MKKKGNIILLPNSKSINCSSYEYDDLDIIVNYSTKVSLNKIRI